MIVSIHAPLKKPVRPPRAVPAAIAKVRDPLLAAQIQAEASVTGSLAAQQNNLQTAGACLNEPIRFSDAPNGLNGLAADLSKLFHSFQALSGDPANLPLRRSVVRNAQAVAAQFTRASSRLDGVKHDLNVSIQKDVAKANQGLNDIAGLNRRIMRAQAAGHSMRLMREETFGPILPVMRFNTTEEAVALANDTEFGLTASVITGTEEQGQQIAEQVNAGSVFVQDTFLTFAKLRKIGTHSFGVSGLGGSRTGPDSIMRFLRRKAILSNQGAAASIFDDKPGDVAGPRR